VFVCVCVCVTYDMTYEVTYDVSNDLTSKESYRGRRDLIQCQKRPNTVSKET
jgi:hypothetical protein